MVSTHDLRQEFARELEHWKAASERLADLDAVASPQAWQALEHYLGVALRQSLATVAGRLRSVAQDFNAQLHAASADADVDQLQAQLVKLRQAYVRGETAVDFYADALATRSIARTAALLRACDHIATRSMGGAHPNGTRGSGSAYLHRQGTWCFESQGRTSTLGRHRREPSRDNQGHEA